jgi:hypothetical protein
VVVVVVVGEVGRVWEGWRRHGVRTLDHSGWWLFSLHWRETAVMKSWREGGLSRLAYGGICLSFVVDMDWSFGNYGWGDGYMKKSTTYPCLGECLELELALECFALVGEGPAPAVSCQERGQEGLQSCGI